MRGGEEVADTTDDKVQAGVVAWHECCDRIGPLAPPMAHLPLPGSNEILHRLILCGATIDKAGYSVKGGNTHDASLPDLFFKPGNNSCSVCSSRYLCRCEPNALRRRSRHTHRQGLFEKPSGIAMAEAAGPAWDISPEPIGLTAKPCHRVKQEEQPAARQRCSYSVSVVLTNAHGETFIIPGKHTLRRLHRRSVLDSIILAQVSVCFPAWIEKGRRERKASECAPRSYEERTEASTPTGSIVLGESGQNLVKEFTESCPWCRPSWSRAEMDRMRAAQAGTCVGPGYAARRCPTMGQADGSDG